MLPWACIALCSGLLSSGCAEPYKREIDVNRASAPVRARQAGFETRTFRSAAGPIRAWWRGIEDTNTVHVYIEGDGRAWLSRTRVSADPTPSDPVAFELALRDPHAAVIYLARPCQFASSQELEGCDPRYWTGRRYAAEVVAAFGDALDQLIGAIRGREQAVQIGLVGYSGGAVISALLLGERSDIKWLVSVAGNLDTDAWTQHHGVDSMQGSLNPSDTVAGHSRTPQVLLVGGDDAVVPEEILTRYVRRRAGRPTAIRTLAGADHRCCWVASWPAINCEPLADIGVNVEAWCGVTRP